MGLTWRQYCRLNDLILKSLYHDYFWFMPLNWILQLLLLATIGISLAHYEIDICKVALVPKLTVYLLGWYVITPISVFTSGMYRYNLLTTQELTYHRPMLAGLYILYSLLAAGWYISSCMIYLENIECDGILRKFILINQIVGLAIQCCGMAYYLIVWNVPCLLVNGGLSESAIRAIDTLRGRREARSLSMFSCCDCYCAYERNSLIKILICNHHFHDNCIHDWLHITGKCSTCNRPAIGLDRH